MCLPLEAYWDFLIYFLRYFSTELSIKKSKKQNCNKMTKTFLITSHLDVVHIFHTLLFPTLHRCSSMASEFNFPPKNLCLPKFSWLWCFPIFRKMRILATYLVNVKCKSNLPGFWAIFAEARFHNLGEDHSKMAKSLFGGEPGGLVVVSRI